MDTAGQQEAQKGKEKEQEEEEQKPDKTCKHCPATIDASDEREMCDSCGQKHICWACGEEKEGLVALQTLFPDGSSRLEVYCPGECLDEEKKQQDQKCADCGKSQQSEIGRFHSSEQDALVRCASCHVKKQDAPLLEWVVERRQKRKSAEAECAAQEEEEKGNEHAKKLRPPSKLFSLMTTRNVGFLGEAPEAEGLNFKSEEEAQDYWLENHGIYLDECKGKKAKDFDAQQLEFMMAKYGASWIVHTTTAAK